jgi:hypothetical protein
MARVDERARTRRAIEQIEANARAAAPVPAEWVGYGRATVIGWGALVVGLVAAWVAWDHGTSVLSAVAIVLCAGVALGAGCWVAHPDTERGGWLAALTALAAGGLWVAAARAGALALLGVVAAGAVAWLVVLVRRRAQVRAMAWAVQLLAEASGDDRPAGKILTPARTSTGLPALWHLPSDLAKRVARDLGTDDEDQDEESCLPGDRGWAASAGAGGFNPAGVLSAGLGYRVVVRTYRGVAMIDVAPPEVSPEIRQYQSQVSKYVQGKVTAFERDGAGAFRRMEFTWPGKAADKALSTVYQQRLERVLQSLIGTSVEANWSLTRRRAVLTSLPELPTNLPRPPRDEEHPMQIQFGQFRGGKACVFDLDGTLPHIAIGGGTGAGKTVLARTLLLGLPRTHGKAVEVWPIDPKMIGFAGLDQIPGVHTPATDPEGFVRYLAAVHAEMMRRYELLKVRPSVRKELAPIVLLIDEGEEMADILNDWWASGEGKEDWMVRRGSTKKPSGGAHPAMKMYLGSILRLGRAARVHVITASQQFSTSWLATSSRSQFGIRIAVSNLEATTSEMLFGSRIATSGLDGNTPGRAWMSIGRGAVPVEAQIYWTPEIEDGLGDKDRSILHGLGVRLPDDPAELEIPGELAVDNDQSGDVDQNEEDPQPTTSAAAGSPDDLAELIEQATEIVLTTQHASTAMLCRKLRIGHELAAGILQMLASAGAVTSSGGDSWTVTAPVEAVAEVLESLGGGDDDQEEIHADVDSLEGELVPVLDLQDGTRVLIDHNGAPTVATIYDIEPDESDPDYMEISYVTEDEERGSVFLTDAETLTVLEDAETVV